MDNSLFASSINQHSFSSLESLQSIYFWDYHVIVYLTRGGPRASKMAFLTKDVQNLLLFWDFFYCSALKGGSGSKETSCIRPWHIWYILILD